MLVSTRAAGYGLIVVEMVLGVLVVVVMMTGEEETSVN